MKDITRRGLILSGAALATGAFAPSAEAATGSISIKIVSAGFIFGASAGSGILTFQGRQYPLSIGGHQRRRDNRRLGHRSGRHGLPHAQPS